MKISILVVLTILACFAFAETEFKSISIHDLMTYNKWRVLHKRNHFNDDEANYRQLVFLRNLQKINEHNSNKDKTYEVGVNEFSDQTEEEFEAKIINNQEHEIPQARNLQSNGTTPPTLEPDMDVPERLDWRTSGAVSPVKTQGNCSGAGFAFAVTSLFESVNLIRNNPLAIYSEQEIIDCTYGAPYYSGGCIGGYPWPAHRYVEERGLLLSSQYPYKNTRYPCSVKADASKAIYAKKPIHINSYNRNATNWIQYHLTKSPLTAVVDPAGWQNYKSGIFNIAKAPIKRLTHSVLLVGYTEGGHWIVKNSWGTTWGQNGYMILHTGDTSNVELIVMGTEI